jgi:hypothetical protein
MASSPRFPVALGELVPPVERGQTSKVAGLRQVRQKQFHAVFPVQAPVATRRFRARCRYSRLFSDWAINLTPPHREEPCSSRRVRFPAPCPARASARTPSSTSGPRWPQGRFGVRRLRADGAGRSRVRLSSRAGMNQRRITALRSGNGSRPRTAERRRPPPPRIGSAVADAMLIEQGVQFFGRAGQGVLIGADRGERIIAGLGRRGRTCDDTRFGPDAEVRPFPEKDCRNACGGEPAGKGSFPGPAPPCA